MALADGDDPFRFLTFGGTFWRTFGIFFDHIDVFLILSAIVMVPFLIIIATYWLFFLSVMVREVQQQAEAAADGADLVCDEFGNCEYKPYDPYDYNNGGGSGSGGSSPIPYPPSQGGGGYYDDDLTNNNDYDPDNLFLGFHPHHIPLLTFVMGLQLITYSIVTILGRGAMCRAVAEIYVNERRPDWKVCLQQVYYSPRKVPLISASLCVTIGLGLPALLPLGMLTLSVVQRSFFFLVIGIMILLAWISISLYIYASTLLVTPALVIEPLPTVLSSSSFGSSLGSGSFVFVEALKRSWDLSAGSRCYILCSLSSMLFIHDLIRRLLHNMFTNGTFVDMYLSLVGIVTMMIPMILFLPLYAILETVMYLNLRVGRESLNHSVLSTDLSVEESPMSEYGPRRGIGIGGGGGGGPLSSSSSPDYRQVPLVESSAGSYAAPIGMDPTMNNTTNNSNTTSGYVGGDDELQLQDVSQNNGVVGMQEIS